jgi:hypothetical protein
MTMGRTPPPGPTSNGCTIGLTLLSSAVRGRWMGTAARSSPTLFTRTTFTSGLVIELVVLLITNRRQGVQYHRATMSGGDTLRAAAPVGVAEVRKGR